MSGRSSNWGRQSRPVLDIGLPPSDGTNPSESSPYSSDFNQSFTAAHSPNNTSSLLTPDSAKSQPKIHWCDICNKPFPYPSRLRDHKEMIHGTKLACGFYGCTKTFSRKAEKDRHRKHFHTGEVWGCAQCRHSEKRKDYTETHMKKAHGWENPRKSRSATCSDNESSFEAMRFDTITEYYAWCNNNAVPEPEYVLDQQISDHHEDDHLLLTSQQTWSCGSPQAVNYPGQLMIPVQNHSPRYITGSQSVDGNAALPRNRKAPSRGGRRRRATYSPIVGRPQSTASGDFSDMYSNVEDPSYMAAYPGTTTSGSQPSQYLPCEHQQQGTAPLPNLGSQSFDAVSSHSIDSTFPVPHQSRVTLNVVKAVREKHAHKFERSALLNVPDQELLKFVTLVYQQCLDTSIEGLERPSGVETLSQSEYRNLHGGIHGSDEAPCQQPPPFSPGPEPGFDINPGGQFVPEDMHDAYSFQGASVSHETQFQNWHFEPGSS